MPSPMKQSKEDQAVAKIMNELSWRKEDELLAKSNYLKASYEVSRLEIAMNLACRVAMKARTERVKKAKSK